MPSEIESIALDPGEGHILSWLGHPIVYKAIGKENADAYALGWGTVPPAQGPKGHIQYNEDEGIYVLDGEITLTAGNQTHRLTPGDFVNIRPGTPHHYHNTGKETAELLAIYAPAGYEKYQMGISPPLHSRNSPVSPYTHEDLDRMKVMAHLYRIDMYPGHEAFQVDPRMTLTLSNQGKVYALVGDLYRVLVAGKDTDNTYALIDAWIPPDGGPPPHIHTRETESFYITEGSIDFTVDGQVIEAGPDTFLQAPPGLVHSFKNNTEDPARMLILAAPAGFDEFVMEAGKPVRNRKSPPPPPTPEELQALPAIAAKYGMEILPPKED